MYILGICREFSNQVRASHTWFLKIEPVWIVSMHVCVFMHVHVCVDPPRLLITSGMIWRDMEPTIG